MNETMRFEECHGKQSETQNLCLPWTSISHDALLMEYKISHGENRLERGSARSVCLGRRDEQNRQGRKILFVAESAQMKIPFLIILVVRTDQTIIEQTVLLAFMKPF